LVVEGGLQLLAGDVAELSFGDEGLGLGADKLLLEDNNFRAVGLFVLELGDLVGDLLLACDIISNLLAQIWTRNIRSLLGWTEASMLRMLLMVTRYWS